ncbi:uncharacterized protein BDV17DRAFT_292931 [Aspergillus undulatus]|uniref:uncharacterized protein n=1 Tax=Aspergillus undulatus TaxID=1810928 RepID=UPI003CCE1C70
MSLQGRWKSEATYCERDLVLNDGATTLAPGQTHQVPFSMKAHIEYELRVSGKVQSNLKEWLKPSHIQKLTMGAPAAARVSAEQTKWTNLSRPLTGKHHGATASVKIPTVLTQREMFPIHFKVDVEGFALVSLKAKLSTSYAIRGRSSFLRESTGAAL